MGQLKCEHCGIEVYWKGKSERKVSAGWVGSGKKSKYGKGFDKKGGRAWFCTQPECQKECSLTALRIFFKGFSEEQIEALYEEAELSRLRRN